MYIGMWQAIVALSLLVTAHLSFAPSLRVRWSVGVRWRKLEGSDPKRYELLQKIQTLQKRLISKTEQCVEKDLLLQEREKLYVDLKNILARQPGPEIAEQLSVYRHSLKEKTRQMKSMAAG